MPPPDRPRITAERLEAILADVLRRGGFKIVVVDGESELQPTVGVELARLMVDAYGQVPSINLYAVARDMERALRCL